MYKVEGNSKERTITFVVAGDIEFNPEDPKTFMSLGLRDAYSLMGWLGYSPTDFGYMDLSELRARCRRRLWPEPRNMDPVVPESREVRNGGRVVIHSCRPAGFLRGKTEELLRLVNRAYNLQEASGIDHDCILFS